MFAAGLLKLDGDRGLPREETLPFRDGVVVKFLLLVDFGDNTTTLDDSKAFTLLSLFSFMESIDASESCESLFWLSLYVDINNVAGSSFELESDLPTELS